MIPILLDPAATRIALIGRGDLAVRRLQWLRDGGASPDVWSDRPSADLSALAGESLIERLPAEEHLGRYHLAWIAELPADEATSIADAARDLGVLVNVEDVVPLCDFHTPAVVRRGKLTLAVGTGGASPAVARAARERLEAAFSDGWGAALDEVAEARRALRAEGKSAAALAEDARARLIRHGLI